VDTIDEIGPRGIPKEAENSVNC